MLAKAKVYAYAILIGLLLFVPTFPVLAQRPPSFTKSFTPDTIGPGSTSTLTFDIFNEDSAPVTAMAFTDNLPAGVVIATPASATSDCGGTLTAPDGGTTISLSEGRLGAYSGCTIAVNVTSSSIGTHANTSGILTSSAGNSGPATADLIVDANRPGFTKSFSPSSIPPGGISTLTFTIDNLANQASMSSLQFADILPFGMVIATSANASTDCTGGALTATPGTDIISLFDGYVAALSSCTVAVDVTADDFGAYTNVAGALASGAVPSGFATAVLDVPRNALIKSFTDDPVPPGDTVTLQFTITNLDRSDAASNISFTDDLDAALSGLVAVGLSANDVCGAGSQLTGASVITLTGGTLAPEASCTFSATLQVPVATFAGTYTNTTSALTFDRGGSPVTESAATDRLVVKPVPILTKQFVGDPVAAGDAVTLTFTITNTSQISSVTDIAFVDVFPVILPTAVSVPSPDFCGSGSTASFTPLGSNPPQFSVSNGNLAPGASCSFDLVLDVAAGAPGGVYPNITSDVTATIDGETVEGGPATDDLVVVAAPILHKSFTDDPVLPGGTVTLEFTISHSGESAPGDATAISFTDDLAATLPGLAATGLPLNDVCGAGSQITGTTNLSFTSGSLAPGESCVFSVTLQVPAGASPGAHANTTSNIVATVSGLTATGNPASDDLDVTGLFVTKSFTDDPAIPGDTATLRFTLDNQSPIDDATGITFTDNLNNVLSGLVAVAPLPTTPCGPGSAIVGTSLLSFTGGNVLAGDSCTFDVTIQVPAGAADGTYNNTTSNVTATLGSSPVILNPATDALTVSSDWLSFSKSFTDDPVAPGETVTLEFTIENRHTTQAVFDMCFTDDLHAALSGLLATGLPASNVCGAGSMIAGTSYLSFSGGNLAAGASCTFQVTLQVPAGAAFGSYHNATSELTGSIGGLGVRGEPATDDLQVAFLRFAKAFDGPAFAGSTASLEFTIENNSVSSGVSDISFSDDLAAVIPGLTAIGLPPDGFCGGGSRLTGASFLTLSGGNLGPGARCKFSVTLQVPASAVPGSFPNTTSDLLSAGLPVSDPAVDTLTIEPPPVFDKNFVPDSIGLGGGSTLHFTIDNTASTLAASGLDFTDNLPAGLEIANPPNGSTTCTGGTLTAVAGTGVIVYTGGTVAAGTSCTIRVDVTSTAVGMHVNVTGDLTSSSGNSGPASDTLTVNPQPGFDKRFSPNPIAAGYTSTLTFTLDNTGSTVAATHLDFTDNLPAGLEIANPPNGSTTCTGGTLTAVAGTGVIAYTGGTVAAGTSCTIQVDVTGTAAGYYANTSGSLTSCLGDSGPASDTLTVNPQPGFDKHFAPNPIATGYTSTLTFTLDNTGSTADATNLDFTDNLPAGLEIADPPNGSTTCTGGTLTAVAGTGVIVYTGGTVAAGTSCTIRVDVTSTSVGMHVNVTGDLTSSSGNSGPASDTLTVNPQPGFDKRFAPNPIAAGYTSTLTFTLDNTGSTVAATHLDFTDNLPAGLVIADPPNGSTTCTGGTLTAVAGTGAITYTGGTVAAGASCTVRVDVTSDAAGDYANTSGNLTSSLGDSDTASDTLTVENADFGDAPDPGYPTLLGNRGASHALGSDVYLGSCVDAELDGQPTPNADGDDTNAGSPVFGTCQEGGDEDGVTFANPLVRGETRSIEVTASTTCTLSAWIDFDADGDWSGADENLFPGGQILAPGVSVLSVTVPAGAEMGDTYARFRCTTDGAVTFTGPASDGEVEDYQVSIWSLTYLPLVMNNYVTAPDLVVESISATVGGVQVVIKNQGNGAVTDDFWVDVYIDPAPVPTIVNQIWPDLADEGLVWGVTDDMLPGDVITLTIGDIYYSPAFSQVSWPLAVGTPVYAQVDSYSGATTYGAVLEDHEITSGAYNNISGDTVGPSAVRGGFARYSNLPPHAR